MQASEIYIWSQTGIKKMLHAAYGLCGDWQHAEDLVQQALVAVARRWDRIRDNPAGYAYRCVVRANIDRWRVWRRRPETELVDEPAAPDERPDDHLAILQLLRALPPRQRAIVVLRYLHDLTEADTAEALGISVGAVKSGASRGLANLRAADPSLSEEYR